MKELSQCALGVQGSTTLAIDAMFKSMRARGEDVIGFAAGEPDFNTPEHIKQAGWQAIEDNFTRYTPTAGILPLREAVCQRLKEDCGLSYEPNQIVVASGAKSAVFAAIQVLANPGDEIILPAPYWVSYYELIQMAGAIPVVVKTTEETGFKMTPEALKAAVTGKTKALILNNPSNPTGAVYTKAELEALASVCVEQDLYVVADEIYYRLIYGDMIFTSFASLGEAVKERTILINGVSKSYAMTGWRLGYAAAPEQIINLMTNYLSHAASAPSSISQKAAVEALIGSQEPIEEMRQAFESRRDFFVERLNQIEGVSCQKPDGAFYIMMNCCELFGRHLHGKLIETVDDFAEVFLSVGKVAVVPGTGFGAPNYIRWSYATDLDSIREGLNRLEAFLK
jgi:Aspartate/tyrosine/aromatic aminotransferase